MIKLIVCLFAVCLAVPPLRAGETPDPRVRTYVDPVRLVWQVATNAPGGARRVRARRACVPNGAHP